MMWRPMAFIGSPPPQHNSCDSAANSFDLVLDRANDDFLQMEPASGKAFVNHPADGRFDLSERGAVRLVNHSMGSLGDPDADRGGNGIASPRCYVPGIHS